MERIKSKDITQLCNDAQTFPDADNAIHYARPDEAHCPQCMGLVPVYNKKCLLCGLEVGEDEVRDSG